MLTCLVGERMRDAAGPAPSGNPVGGAVHGVRPHHRPSAASHPAAPDPAAPDGLRREALNYGVRVTAVEPGAVATELTDGIKDEGMRKAVTAPGSFYAPDAKILQDVDVAQAILYVVTQPLHVNIGELMLRPTSQEF